MHLIKLSASPKVQRIFTVVVYLLIFFMSFTVVSYRLDQAPDIFTDEIIYTRASLRVSGEGALVWDSGEPFLVHPPFYFLSQGFFQLLTGSSDAPLYAAGDIFSSVYHARTLNALLTGFTAVLLFALGSRLRGFLLGILLVLLFFLDPFGLRINRRAMIETLAALLSLGGMAFLFSAIKKPGQISLGRVAGAGFFFGLALLSKELTFINLVILLFYGVWELIIYWKKSHADRGRGFPIAENQNQRFHLYAFFITFATIFLAGITYLIYPLWVVSFGGGSEYFGEKLLGFQRMLGLVQLTGWNRPGISLYEILAQRLADYGSSYLLLAAGGAATLFLAVWRRDSPQNRLLVTWGMVLYPFFAFLALAGSGNDQFFYFLLIPAIVLSGYALLTLKDLLQNQSKLRNPVFLATAGLLLACLFAFNLQHWWTSYVTGQDNGYAQMRSFVHEHLPPDAPLNATGDPVKFRYFFPNHTITTAATPAEAQELGINFFFLAPKDVRSQYGQIQPELAEWIQRNGHLLFAVTGDSYGEIYLYRVNQSGGGLGPTLPPDNGDTSHWRSFQPAQAGFVAPLVLLLFSWAAFLAFSSWMLGSIPLSNVYLHETSGKIQRLFDRTQSPGSRSAEGSG